MKPKIAYTWSQSIVCGGTIVPAIHVKLLRKAGFDANIYADDRNSVLEEYAGVEIRPRSELEELTEDDILVNVWWMTAEEEKKLKPKRKFQLIQGNDAFQYESVELKENVLSARNDKSWNLIAVSKYAGEWTGRPFNLVPNGVHERFLKQDWPDERDIDVLIEGNDEPNKNIDLAIKIAKSTGAKRIVWLGRETHYIDGVECITNPPQEKIPELYARSKVFLKLSKSEGFCLPILEAMACGAIVVTWPMGGNDFCVDKVNCMNQSNPELLAAFVESITNGVLECEEIRKAARRTAESYSWDNIVKLLLALFS